MITTCQICGRAIKAASGLIAHHGFRRPEVGWQTGSCPGARFAPYEVSRDRIPQVIAHIRGALLVALKAQAEPPPPVLHRPSRITRFAPSIPVSRPEGFDPANLGIDQHNSRSYAWLWVKHQAEIAGRIRECERSIKELTARYEAWTPVYTVPAA